MNRKQQKQTSEIANYILNNITISETLHILAKKSQEIAEQIVKEDLKEEEYKNLILEINKEKKVGIADKLSFWVRSLFQKKEEPAPQTLIPQQKEEPTEKEPIKQPSLKSKFRKKEKNNSTTKK